jgi:hypothetical protein
MLCLFQDGSHGGNMFANRSTQEDFRKILCRSRRWNRLVLQMERPRVFYECEWALALRSAYQASLKPLRFR